MKLTKLQLRQIVREEIVKSKSKQIKEQKLKIVNRAMSDIPNTEIGYVDTKLIDTLLKQIGPHIGYPDWEKKIKKADHKYIIQLIAKGVSDRGPLNPDPIEFV